MKRLLFAVMFLLVCSYAYGQPAISTVSGSLAHDGSVLITGTNFGTKPLNPNTGNHAPRVWDACDANSNAIQPDNVGSLWAGNAYPECVCSGGVCDDTNVSYTTARYWPVNGYPDLGGTPMGGPHSRVTKYIAGSNSSCNGAWGSTNAADLMFHTSAWGSPKLFAMFYYRVSPTYSLETDAASDNFKEFNAPGGGNDLDPYYYAAYGTGNSTPPSAWALGNDADFYASASGQNNCSGPGILHTNPCGNWIHIEFRWDTTGHSFMGSDNISRTWRPGDANNPTAVHGCLTMPGTTQRIGLGGFVRYPRTNNSGNYRYWTAIYADDTYARVILGNRSTWDASFKREPQIPVGWANGAITFQANLGSFTTETNAWLYVWDSNNNMSAGFPVTLSQTPITTTSTTATGLSTTTTTTPVSSTSSSTTTYISSSTTTVVTTTTTAPPVTGVGLSGVSLE